MNKLLFDEKPLIVLPSLVKRLGSMERAVVLQQIHWLLQQPKSGINRDGYHWVWGSYAEWCEDYFPFWQPAALRRHIVWLEENGLLVSAQYGKDQWSRTKSYRIEYSRLYDENETSILHDRVVSIVNDDPPSIVNDHIASMVDDHAPSITETSTESSTGEKEKPSDTPGVAMVFSCYETNIGQLTAYLSELIAQAVDDFGAVLVMDAIKTATTANVRKWAYVNGILERWRANGRSKPKGQPTHQPGEKFKVQFPGDVVEEIVA